MLNLDEAQRKFSIRDLAKSGEKFDEEWNKANKLRIVDAKRLDSYQKGILELGDNLSLYRRLGDMGRLYLLPPLKEGEDWRQLQSAVAPDGRSVTFGEGTRNPPFTIRFGAVDGALEAVAAANWPAFTPVSGHLYVPVPSMDPNFGDLVRVPLPG